MGGSSPSDRSSRPPVVAGDLPVERKAETEGPLSFGVVVKPHGLKGWLKVKPFRPDTTGLGEVATVVMRTANGEHRLKVRSVREDRLGYLLLVEGCHDRNGAERWRGSEVALPREELGALEPDEFYIADLVGLRAFDPQGRELGVVASVGGTPAHDLLTLRRKQREVLVPLTDRFVVDLDTTGGRIVLDLPEGLPETEVKSDPDPEP
jgi:16S rRNA processing protein RimM